MKCKHEPCNNEVTGKGSYCSPTCKTLYNRNKKRNTVTPKKTVTPAVTPVTEQSVTPSQQTGILTPELLAQLPGGVSVPTAQPTARTQAMTAQQLRSRVSSYTGIQWKHSEEYAEVIHRLLTWTLQELKESGQQIPAWKAA